MRRHDFGFTLLEILVALFIFTLLSMMLAQGLHHVINMQSRVTQHADRLHQLQLALLMMSRDIEQTINRPIIIHSGNEEKALIGDQRSFTFTHLGLANPTETLARSTMQRTRYQVNDNRLWRTTWVVVDQAPQSLLHSRQLLAITRSSFKYLDQKGRFHNKWPIEGKNNEPLPRAVRVSFTLPEWGEMSQLYVIPQS